jgi:hypothetical protein
VVIRSEEMRRHSEKLNNMYVRIVGVFHAVPTVSGRPALVIKDVKACGVWSDPARPLEPYGKGGKRPPEPKEK